MSGPKIVPILTAEQYRKAEVSGAAIEFTACGCDYTLQPGESGWIEPFNSTGWIQIELADGTFSYRVRAIYPAPTPSLISRVAAMFRRKATQQ